LCRLLAPELRALGYAVQVLDGDEMRVRLCRDLGFSKADRDANVRRIGCVASALVERGYIVLVAAISPYRQTRLDVSRHIGHCVEVYVNAPLALCIARDPKRLYARALAGELLHFTGIDDPYEPPLNPHVRCDTDEESSAESAARVLAAIRRLRSAHVHARLRVIGEPVC
jgi:adenylylsulfate kinase